MPKSLKTFYPKLPLYLLVVLIPLIHLPQINASVFAAPKLFVLRIITLAMLGFISYGIFTTRQFSFKKSPFNILLLLLAVAIFLSTVFSEYIFTSLLGIDGRFLGFFTMINFLIISFLSFNTFSQPQDLRQLLKISLFVATLTAIYGIIQGQSWFEEITREIFKWGISPSLRTFSTFGHSTHFALYLGMHLPIAIGFLFTTPKNKKRFQLPLAGLLLSIVFLTWALFTTASRGALAATIISIIGFGSWAFFKTKTPPKKIIAISILALIVIATAILSFTSLNQSFRQIKTVQRIETMFTQLQAGQVTDRQSWWHSSLAMWKDASLIGHGLSTFADVYNRYRRTDYVLAEDSQDITVPHYAHMDYFNILATQGVIGLITYLALICWVFYRVYQFITTPRLSSADQIIVISVTAALAVFLLNMFVSFGVISTMTLFYLLLGATAGITSVRPKIIKPKIPAPATSLILLVIVIGGAIYSFTHYSADLYKSQAIRSQFRDQEDAYKKAISLVPTEYSFYADYADLLVQKAQLSEDIAYSQSALRQALTLYEKAESINDSHPYINNHIAIAAKELAKIAADNGDPSNYNLNFKIAESNYALAVEKGPNNPRYLYNFAEFYFLAGEYTEAIDLYQKILAIRDPYRNVYDRLYRSYLITEDQEKANFYQQKSAESSSKLSS